MVPKELQDARETYQNAVQGTERLLRTMQGQGIFAVDSAESVVELVRAQLEVCDALMVPYLGGLTRAAGPAAVVLGPCILALRIGMELHLPRPEATRLGTAALLHELGGRGEAAGRRGLDELAERARARGSAHADVAEVVLRGGDILKTARRGLAEAPRVEVPAQVMAAAIAYHRLARDGGPDDRAWPPACLKDFLRRYRSSFPDTVLRALIRVLATLPLGSL